MAQAELVSLEERRAQRGETEMGDGPAGRDVRTDPVRTLVVDDDPHAREALAGTLAAETDIEVVASVAAYDEAHALLGPEVVVVGHRAAGLTVAPLATSLRADAPPGVVVVASWPRAALLRRALQAGARGFVQAECGREVLLAAVRTVAFGEPYVDPSLGRLVLELVVGGEQPRPYHLTRAEYDVVTLLPRGLMNREIAAELGITENTVKTHLRHALRKLAVRDRAQAAALVVREGLA